MTEATRDSSLLVADDAPKPSLRQRLLRAGGWTMGGHFLSQALRLVSTLVMTRLLVPEMFGVMAIATVVQVVVSLLSDIGLRQAIMQSPQGNTPVMLNTAFTLQNIRGAVIWGVCCLIAGGIALAAGQGLIPAGSVYAAPDLPLVIVAASFVAVINGFQSTKHMTMNRDLDMKRVTLIELISQVAALAVMVLMGWLTRSIWAFVVGSLAQAAVSVVLSHTWLRGMPNRWLLDRDAARDLLRFGRWVLLSSVLGVMAAQADRLLLGAWMPAAMLGLYVIAYNLASMVEGAGSKLFGSVTMAAFSEVARNDPSRFRSVYFRTRLPFDLGFILCAGFLYAAGPAVVDLFYDDRYLEAGRMLQILSWSLLFARYGVLVGAYIALGVPQYLAVLHAVKLIGAFGLIPLGYYLGGVNGALWGVALNLAPTVPCVLWLNRRHNLNSYPFEIAVLAAWPVGWLLGLAFEALLHLIVPGLMA